jgi:hypothetical protein
MLKKWLLPAFVSCAALAALSCDVGPIVTLDFVGPTEGKRVPPGPVKVKVWWTTASCFMDSMELRVDGGPVGVVGGSPVPDTCVFNWDATGIPRGTRPRLFARAFYSYVSEGVNLNSEESTWINVRVDTGGPELVVVLPAEGDSFYKGTVPIKAWARDTSVGGMSRVEFFVDDVLTDSDSFPERDTWRSFWDASQAAGGNHLVKAVAYNLYDEMAAEQLTVFVRDTITGGGPTYHHGYVDASETWSPGGNPHIVDGDVVFRNGARLTIEPGCIVKFDGFALAIGTQGDAGLTAVGTAAAPILFTSNRPVPSPGDGGGISFGAGVLPGTRLSYCTIEYAGALVYDGAAIYMGGGGIVDEISNCTIRNSAMYGIFCREYAGFGAFRNNVVTANLGYAIHVDAGRAGLLAAGNALTGNDSAGVELYGRISTSATWPDIGVPYVIKDVSVGDSTNDAVLTIENSVEIRFRKTGTLASGQSGKNLRARILADGSAGRIRFTSLAGTPAPGDFCGVSVYEGPSGESEFRKCDFSYGGGSGGDNGMLYVRGRNPVITGCDFGYSKGWGITFTTASVPDTAALKAVNTFHDNGSGAIKWIRLFPGE